MFIVRGVYWLVNKIFGYKPPKKVKHFKAEIINMSNIRLSWGLPNVSNRQRPIMHTEISVRVDAALPWTLQDTVDVSSTQELVQFDAVPGTQFFKAVVFDIDGRAGPEALTNATVDFDAPGMVIGFTSVVEG
jgi:hypothetical protein